MLFTYYLHDLKNRVMQKQMGIPNIFFWYFFTMFFYLKELKEKYCLPLEMTLQEEHVQFSRGFRAGVVVGNRCIGDTQQWALHEFGPMWLARAVK